MIRDLPALAEALEDWRDLAADRDAAEALLPFDEVRARVATLHSHLGKLRRDPPQFDTLDLAAVLDLLPSAQRLRGQIVEGNELEVLVPTLRAFLFDEGESVEEKFRSYPARIRYAGYAILGELWGWAHADRWPIYNQRALRGVRLLGWELPARDYPAFNQALTDLRAFYEQGRRVAPRLPLFAELDEFLGWVVASQRPPAAPGAAEPPRRERLAEAGRRRSYAIREFGAPYDVALAPPSAWPDRPLPTPSVTRLAGAEATIRSQLALPPHVVERAAAHLLAGRHLLLTGVPGTGKSHLASLLTTELFGYHPLLVTATAEWSTFDVVGGLVPVASEAGALRYEVRPGVVYEALRRNWLLADDGSVRRTPDGQPLRIGSTHEGRQWPGVWLLIDELNRADVDKAFGELFTALESGALRVPRVGSEPSFLMPLPQDFRIIATLNSRDRHFLFTLSDALKRRFAFLELEPPSDGEGERATLLQRSAQALAAQGRPVEEKVLHAALEALLPGVWLLRAFHPLGTAPLLAALRYIGSAQQLSSRPLSTLVQEAVIAELLPQVEGLRDLPVRLLALLFRGDHEGAAALLHEALAQAYGDAQPLRALRALATRVSPSLAAQAAALQQRPSSDPATFHQALELLTALRREGALPAPAWPLVAAALDRWER